MGTRLIETTGFKKTEKYFNVLQDNTYTCKCGHRVVIPKRVKKVLCGWCNRAVYKSAKDEYNDILNQIKIKKEELHQIREKLISLVFPNKLCEEVQNITNETLFEESKLDLSELKIQSKTKKKTKPE